MLPGIAAPVALVLCVRRWGLADVPNLVYVAALLSMSFAAFFMNMFYNNLATGEESTAIGPIIGVTVFIVAVAGFFHILNAPMIATESLSMVPGIQTPALHIDSAWSSWSSQPRPWSSSKTWPWCCACWRCYGDGDGLQSRREWRAPQQRYSASRSDVWSSTGSRYLSGCSQRGNGSRRLIVRTGPRTATYPPSLLTPTGERRALRALQGRRHGTVAVRTSNPALARLAPRR